MSASLYVKLDVNYLDDPKVMSVTSGAELLYIRSLCLAKRLLSDGFIARPQLRRLAGDIPDEPLDAGAIEDYAAELVHAGLWHPVAMPSDDRSHTDRSCVGWQITAWEKHNDTSDEVAEKIEAKRIGGALGNHKRWHKGRRGNPRQDCEYCLEEGLFANRSQDRSQDRSHSESLTDRSAVAKVSPETETETETENPPHAHAREAEPGPDPQPPDPGGNSKPNPEPVLAHLEAGMPPDVSPGWRQDRAIPHARRAIAQRLAAGWQPRELADAIAQSGWRGVDRPAAVIASRAVALADTTAPSVVHARRMAAEQADDERRQTEAAETDRRRAELDAALDALDDGERQALAVKAAAALPVSREPDLAIPGVRAMARSILADAEGTER